MKDIVYHGSLNGNIDSVKAHVSTHGKKCIYATENRTVAMLFMGEGKGDLDTVLAVDDEKGWNNHEGCPARVYRIEFGLT